jgi:23S rRNA-/tRNA-specific pseudouridylate synthase
LTNIWWGWFKMQPVTKFKLLLLKGIFCKWRHSEVELQSKSFWCSTRDADASSFENHIVPENIPLDIVYEDDTLLLINKSQEWLFIPDMETIPGL